MGRRVSKNCRRAANACLLWGKLDFLPLPRDRERDERVESILT